MKEEKNQIHLLVALALFSCALLIGYNVFFSPPLPLINEIKTESPLVESNIEPAGKKVNLNTATKEQLCTLKGIGPVTAEKILAYREEQGGFSSLEELMQVDGIGQKTFEQIKYDITLES